MDKEYFEEHNYEYDTIVFDSGSIQIYQHENSYTEDTEDDVSNIFPDYWISNNRIDLTYIFDDIKEMSYVSAFMDNCDLDEFCDFMDYINNLSVKSVCDWENYDLRIFVNHSREVVELPFLVEDSFLGFQNHTRLYYMRASWLVVASYIFI